jgi:HD superfamily phosphodiesterase
MSDELSDNEVADRLLHMCYIDEIKDLRAQNAKLLAALLRPYAADNLTAIVTKLMEIDNNTGILTPPYDKREIEQLVKEASEIYEEILVCVDHRYP